jgi:pilus assembly protein CpaF
MKLTREPGDSSARLGDFRLQRKSLDPAIAEANVKSNGKDAATPYTSTSILRSQVRPRTDEDDYLDLKVRLHRRIIEEVNLAVIEKMGRPELRVELGKIVDQYLRDETKALNLQERDRISDELMDEILGLGPLEPLLKDETVSDILVNTPYTIFVERAGVLQETNVRFKDDEHLARIIDRIVVAVGRRVDESTPLVDARLPDGSRVNVAIPPIALDGALVSIRKFAKIPYDLDRLVEIGSMPPELASVLKGVVACRLNLLISGGTGTGKTTLLNAVSRYINSRERIVTIEDAAELQLQQKHVCRMETRPSSIEGKGEITQRDLVKNALRMRPDRIILGEVRGGEAFDMLQAMNTGHDGSITTVHANTPRDALSRIEQMVGMSNLDVPAKSIRAQIASALDVVVQIKRFADGARRVISLQEITGIEGDVVTMQEVICFKQSHIGPDGRVHGKFVATGIRPHVFEAFKANDIAIPALFGVDS